MKAIPLHGLTGFGMFGRRMVRVPEEAVLAAGMLLSNVANSYKRARASISLLSSRTLAS